MILLPRHKAVYVSCGRTGSHTMFAVLQKHYEGRYHRPYDDPHCKEVPADCAGWLLFRTVRNPYPRAVSIYRAIMMQPARYNVADMTFEAFAAGLAGWRWQKMRMAQAQHLWHFGIDYDVTLHIENLDEEVQGLPFWDGPEHVEAATNTTAGKPWMDEYTPEIARDVERWAGPEFELYGYERLSWQAPSSQS